MTPDQTVILGPDSIRAALVAHLSSALRSTVTAERDLFADGLVSSMAAMQLVMHLEQTYDIEVVGRDLRLENFRTVDSMVELVLRLRETADR